MLKYDRVKVFNGFVYKIYTLESLKEDTVDELYLKLKSKKRTLNKIKAKINKLNKYYNSPAELFARSFELYITNKTKLKTIAPNVYEKYETIVKNNSNLLILNFIKFYK